MFKDVVPEEEFSKIKSMQPGESVRYSLVLANIHKKGLQKLEFAVEKQIRWLPDIITDSFFI